MSKRIGRRTFVKGATSAFLGLATAPLVSAAHSSAKKSTNQAVEYRILGKTGLKVTVVGMGVMNCNDPAVLLRAFDLGVNFYDTARIYMHGRNERMVGKVFQGKRDKVLIQTKVILASNDKTRGGASAALETGVNPSKRVKSSNIDVQDTEEASVVAEKNRRHDAHLGESHGWRAFSIASLLKGVPWSRSRFCIQKVGFGAWSCQVMPGA